MTALTQLGFALLPLVGFLASGRRRPPKIRLCVRGWVTLDGAQVVQFEIRDRSGMRHAIGRELSGFDPEAVNRQLLQNAFRKLRDGWRDHVLPKDWREKRGARYRRLAQRPRSPLDHSDRGRI